MKDTTTIRAFFCAGLLALCLSASWAQRPEARQADDPSPMAGLVDLPERNDLTLSGVVVDGEEWPVAEIALWKYIDADAAPAGGADPHFQVPDADGRFRFSALSPGVYTLSLLQPVPPADEELHWFWRPAHSVRRLLIRPEDNLTTLTLHVPGKGHIIRGQVLDDGEPLQNVRVGVGPQFKSDIAEYGDLTDAEGHFKVGGLAPGPYLLMFEKQDIETPGRYRVSRELIEVDTDIEHEFQYELGHELKVRIDLPSKYREAAGDEFTQALLFKPDLGEALDVIDDPTTGGFRRTIAQGHVEGEHVSFTGLFQGDHFLLPESSGGQSPRLPPIALNIDNLAGDTSETLRVPPPGRLEIRIENMPESTSMTPSMSFSLKPEGLNWFGQSVLAEIRDGRCVIELLPGGRYWLQAERWLERKILLPYSQEILVQPGETTTVTLRAESMTGFQATIFGLEAPGTIFAREAAGTVMGIDVQVNSFVTPDRVVVRGPVNFEFFPGGGRAKSEASSIERPPSYAAYNRIVLYDLLPGEYTLEVEAKGFESLHETFRIEKRGEFTSRDLDLIPLH